jgi:hypothetical protein
MTWLKQLFCKHEWSLFYYSYLRARWEKVCFKCNTKREVRFHD